MKAILLILLILSLMQSQRLQQVMVGHGGLQMKQVFSSRTTNTITTGTQFNSPVYLRAWSATESLGDHPWAVAGRFKNLIVKVPTAPGAGNSWTFTFRLNGVDTSLTTTISDTATTNRDTSNSIAVIAGDIITLKKTAGGSPGQTDVIVAIEFWATNARESGYGSKCDASLGTTTNRWTGPFSPANGAWNSSAGTNIQNVVAAAGVLDGYYMRLDGSPGSGKSYNFAVYKNGTKQDGSGGTVDTRLSIADSSTSGNVSFSLSLSPGDLVYIEAVPTNTPTARGAAFGVKFTATTNGESQYCGSPNVSMSATQTQYAIPSGMRDSDAYSATESARDVIGGVTSFTLKNMQVWMTGAAGASPRSYTLSLRKNGAGAGPSVVIAGSSQTTGSDTASATIVDGDTFSYEEAPSATAPTVRASRWSWIQYVP